MHLPAENAYSQCGGELRKLGEDVSEMLKDVPGSFKVIRHVRPKLCCARGDAILEAAAPSRPIGREVRRPPSSRSSVGDYAREGVELDRSTLTDRVGPLVDQVRRHVLEATKLHADDTPVPVLASGGARRRRRGPKPTCAMIVRSAMMRPPAVWFAYSEDRKGDHPRQHLSKFTSILQTDGYAGFHHLYEGGSFVEATCWAHVR